MFHELIEDMDAKALGERQKQALEATNLPLPE
jgi:hypothetical protein